LLGAVSTIGAVTVGGAVVVVVVVVVVSAELTVVINATGNTATKRTRAKTERIPRLVRTVFMAFLSHFIAPSREIRDLGRGHSALLCVVVHASPSDKSVDSRSGLRYFVKQLFSCSVVQFTQLEQRSAWAGTAG
jgi:hypothetical protein